MDPQNAVDLCREAVRTALVLASPLLLAALAVGVVVGVLQTVTQVQDAAIASIPKLLVVGAVALLVGPWLLQYLAEYTELLLHEIPQHLQSR